MKYSYKYLGYDKRLLENSTQELNEIQFMATEGMRKKLEADLEARGWLFGGSISRNKDHCFFVIPPTMNQLVVMEYCYAYND